MVTLQEVKKESENLKNPYSEILELLTEAEDDVKNGRVAPITETFDDLRKMLHKR